MSALASLEEAALLNFDDFCQWWRDGGSERLPAFQAYSDRRTSLLPNEVFMRREHQSFIGWAQKYQGWPVNPEMVEYYKTNDWWKPKEKMKQ